MGRPWKNHSRNKYGVFLHDPQTCVVEKNFFKIFYGFWHIQIL